MKACSTLVALFALASINGMPISSAKALYVNQELFQSIKHCTIRTNSNKKMNRMLDLNLCCIIRHCSVIIQVRLISNQKLVHVFACIAINFTQPLLNIVETFLISYIINYLPGYSKKRNKKKRFHQAKRKKNNRLIALQRSQANIL